MFENPGGKLKVIAEFLAMICIACCLLGGVSVMFLEYSLMGVFEGLALAIGGSLACYLVFLLLSLFADMGENLYYIRLAGEEKSEDEQDNEQKMII